MLKEYILYYFLTMEVFELALNQGITNFRRERDVRSRKLIKSVVEYFQEEINQDLVNKYGFRKKKFLFEKMLQFRKGYIQTTIISKGLM